MALLNKNNLFALLHDDWCRTHLYLSSITQKQTLLYQSQYLVVSTDFAFLSALCNLDCGKHGICDSGKCRCDPGWTGARCEQLPCDDRCQEHGQCRNGTCVCSQGWNGRHCTLRKELYIKLLTISHKTYPILRGRRRDYWNRYWTARCSGRFYFSFSVVLCIISHLLFSYSSQLLTRFMFVYGPKFWKDGRTKTYSL